MAEKDQPPSGNEQPSSSNKITEVLRPGPDDERWEARARDLQFNELPNIQAKASPMDDGDHGACWPFPLPYSSCADLQISRS